MLMKLPLSIIFIILFCPLTLVLAQEGEPLNLARAITPEEMKWDTFGNGDDEFHARLPKPPSVFSTYRTIKGTPTPERVRVYGSYEDGVACIIVVYDKTRKEASFDDFVNDFKNRFLSTWEMKFEHALFTNTDEGKLYSLKKGDVTGAARVYVKTKHAYLVLAAAHPSNNSAVERFLDSFTMWAYPLDKMRGPSAPPGSDTPSVAAPGPGLNARENVQQTTASKPEDYVLPGIKAIASPNSNIDKIPAINETDSVSASQGNGASESSVKLDNARTFDESEVTRKAFVILQPEPDYTGEARANRIEGSVRLRGVLSSSGKVSNISVLEGLPYGLSEKAIQAFGHLVFLPALNGDSRVSQWATVEYDFKTN